MNVPAVSPARPVVFTGSVSVLQTAMAWVKSEYAGELAVLSTWLVGVAPWAVTVFGNDGLRVVVLRFLPFRFQFIFGVEFSNEVPFLPAWQIAEFQQAPDLVLAGHLGFAALLVFLVPFGLSLYYYVAEKQLEARLPADPVRLFGGLLGLVGVLTTAASVLFVRSFPGTTVPLGAVVGLVLAYLLLTVDRTE